MDNKFYVSFEAARLLKEKGYNEECNYIIDDDGDIFEDKYRINQDLSEWKWSCPTKAEAIDWLESKEIVVIVDDYYIMREEDDCYTLCWGYYIRKDDECVCRNNSSDYKTRLEAEDAAIIKALELL